MRKRAIVGLGAVASVVLLTGACGSSTEKPKPAAAKTTASPKAADNGISAKSAEEIFNAANEAMKTATSVHVKGAFADNGQTTSLDLQLSQGQGQGTMSGPYAAGKNVSFDLVSSEGKFYMRSANLWGEVASPTFQQLIGNRWVVMPIESKDAADFKGLSDLQGLAAVMMKDRGTLTKGGATTVNGQPAIGVTGSDGSVTYVATTGTPYVLSVTPPSAQAGQSVTFTDWNAPLKITAPADAIDFAKLKKSGA